MQTKSLLLEAQNLSYKISEKTLIDNVSLSIDQGNLW